MTDVLAMQALTDAVRDIYWVMWGILIILALRSK